MISSNFHSQRHLHPSHKLLLIMIGNISFNETDFKYLYKIEILSSDISSFVSYALK